MTFITVPTASFSGNRSSPHLLQFYHLTLPHGLFLCCPSTSQSLSSIPSPASPPAPWTFQSAPCASRINWNKSSYYPRTQHSWGLLFYIIYIYIFLEESIGPSKRSGDSILLPSSAFRQLHFQTSLWKLCHASVSPSKSPMRVICQPPYLSSHVIGTCLLSFLCLRSFLHSLGLQYHFLGEKMCFQQ